MKVSLNLIRQFADIKLDENELIERVSRRIGEIDSVEKLGPKYEGVIIGRIVETKDHPGADKLGVYKVDIGGGKTVQVVAGDKALKIGDAVAYIPSGRAVPSTREATEPLMITERQIRGENSQGMLASAKELDLGQDHSGVLVLDIEAEAGQDLAPLYELDDTIIEVENKVLTHRPDTFGHIGFAREIAGIQNLKFTSPDWLLKPLPDLKPMAPELGIKAINAVPELSARLSFTGYAEARVAEGPLLIRSYLQRLGIRPLNSVVDITNYLMLVTGQPLHAFDYDKLAAKSKGDVELQVRRAQSGERLKLLNGQTIKLDTDDLVIATDSTAVSLAGVMGGVETEVDQNTKRVVIEAANFNMYTIRNTSMRHGLFTDAVTRFARGQDPALCAPAQAQAAQMISDIADGKLATGLVESFDHPRNFGGIVVEADKINNLLGSDYSPEDMAQTLNNVEVDTVPNKGNLDVSPPTWRPDLKIAEDVAEEIGRLNGYDTLPVTVPSRTIKPTHVPALEEARRQIRQTLRAAGGYEVLTYSGVSADLLQKAQQDNALAFAIKNALSPELEFMRMSLTPSLLDKVYPNLRRGFEQFALFELGTTHHKKMMAGELPDEQPAVAFIIAASQKAEIGGQAGAPYYQAAHWLQNLLGRLQLGGASLVPLEPAEAAKDDWLAAVSSGFEPKRSALVVSDQVTLGVVGEYKASVRAAFKLPNLAAGFELNLNRLHETKTDNLNIYEPMSRFPKVENDMTFKVDSDQSYAAVRDALIQELSGSKLRYELVPRDIFAPDETSRHLTFRVWSWHDERTLTTKEVNEILDSAAAVVAEVTGASRI